MKNMFKPVVLSLAALLLATGVTVTPALAEKSSPSQEASQPAKAHQPIVAVVKADWCPACKKISPTIMGLVKDYKSKAQWVILDVTNKQTTAEAEKKVKELGLEEFYAKYGSRTSTVAIIDPHTKEVLSVFAAEGRREKYVAALKKALVAH